MVAMRDSSDFCFAASDEFANSRQTATRSAEPDRKGRIAMSTYSSIENGASKPVFGCRFSASGSSIFEVLRRSSLRPRKAQYDLDRGPISRPRFKLEILKLETLTLKLGTVSRK